jgi:hypothetical protein
MRPVDWEHFPSPAMREKNVAAQLKNGMNEYEGIY